MTTAQSNLARKLTIIPAFQQPEEICLRVAAYCRVSSDSDDQLNSFAVQNAYYTETITSKQNWTLVDVYADEGITGTSAAIRNDFQRLMRDCRKGLIDKILTKSISRFARNTKECLEATRELKSLGIGVVFEEQHIDTSIVAGEMLTAIFAAAAQAESESISANIRWGIRKRMEQGTFLPSHQPFGYILVDKAICIDIPRARFVCVIFQMYLDGYSTLYIAEYLQKLQPTYPELQNYVWTAKAVARILRNVKYTGNSLWQKTYRTQTLPRKEYKNRGEVEQYYAESTHPAIIMQDAFDRTGNLMDLRRTAGINGEGPGVYYGRLVCGCCGANMRGKTVRGIRYRVCRQHTEDLLACDMKPIVETEIEEAFCRMYYKLKHDGIRILEDMMDRLNRIRERQMLWSPDVIEINKRISVITNQSHRLALLNKQCAVDPDIFISKSNQLAEQLRKAKQEKDRLLDQRDDDTIQKTCELLEALECGPEFPESFDGELFCELVAKVSVSKEQIRFQLKNGLELSERRI